MFVAAWSLAAVHASMAKSTHVEVMSLKRACPKSAHFCNEQRGVVSFREISYYYCALVDISCSSKG